eukprot:TRINITY_DN48749_c0_g1_i1.p1 TRINITY_DN48749_c0_g1~~TRINITY_DN48749_c0_g1_i1.p1  ORF type:complete len:581 (-),score=52.78 TRINITY_DN48749_c0_g1_i1:170-1912(-)
MAPILSVPVGSNAEAALQRFGARIPLSSFGISAKELGDMDLREQFRLACTGWARSGMGIPFSAHTYYGLKAILYLAGFWVFQAGSSRCWSLRQLFDKCTRSDAFRRFVVYNLLWEVLGLGCGSGPLTARFLPPHTAWFHFLCPGTMKLPFRTNARDSRRPLLPLSTRRNRFDVLLFATYLASLLRALTMRRVSAGACRSICGLLSALALVDHTVFLASRGEVYGYMTLAFAAKAPVGAQLVQLGIYFWAAVSKLGPWFPNVIQVMLSNSPCCPKQLRPYLYKDVDKSDLRPSRLSKLLAVMGTVNEIAIPALLPFGGIPACLGMSFALSMHTFIFTNFAVGVPQEWNIFSPIACCHLFLDTQDGLDFHALRTLPSHHPLFAAFLLCSLVAVPIAGSLYPPCNSFLTSMKYYAGNWPATAWLVRRDAWHKLEKLYTLADFFPNQMRALYTKEEARMEASLRLYAFRAMHLPYRMLPSLVETALQGRPFNEYQYMEGELMAGTILGYNFGDGYLHGRFMLQSVQDTCGFAPGELILISIDSCPAHRNEVPWFIRDATALWDDAAAVGIGWTALEELREAQPY